MALYNIHYTTLEVQTSSSQWFLIIELYLKEKKSRQVTKSMIFPSLACEFRFIDIFLKYLFPVADEPEISSKP